LPFECNLQRYAAARAILQRATRVFVKRHVDAHLALARFEERQGDVEVRLAAPFTLTLFTLTLFTLTLFTSFCSQNAFNS
jgi:hypothetical protein